MPSGVTAAGSPAASPTRQDAIAGLARGQKRGVGAVGAHLGHAGGSGGERVAYQVLDGKEQTDGKDRGGTLNHQRADLRWAEPRVLGQTTQRRVCCKRCGDTLKQSIQCCLATAVGWTRDQRLQFGPVLIE